MGRLWQAVIANDVRFLSGWVSGRQMLVVSAEDVTRWLPGLLKMASEVQECYRKKPEWGKWEGYSDGFVDLYFRARMSQDHLYPHGCNPPLDIHVPVELHIGFLSLEETAEMLENLRRTPEPETKSGPSTPGIERTLESPTPIDRTAARVVDTKNFGNSP